MTIRALALAALTSLFVVQAPPRVQAATRARAPNRTRRDESGASVSVIIPAYRASKTIERAVQSVLDQSVAPREILVVDDGSPDHAELAQALSPFGSQVTMIGKRNGGASSARNLGIDRATSDLVAFLDADDFWEPHKLESQLAVFDEHKGVGLVGAHLFLQEPGATRAPDPAIDERLFDRVLTLSGTDAFHAAGMFWTGTVMIRRDVLGADRFDESLSTAEDRDLWMRLLSRTPSYLLGEPLATCVLEPGSLSRSNIDRDCKNLLTVIDRYRNQLGPVEHGRWSSDVHRRWSTRHLASGNARAAFAPAIQHLRATPSPTALWTVVKSAAMGATEVLGGAACEGASIRCPRVRVSIVDDLAGFQALADEWRALHQRSAADVISLDHDWLYTWWEIFGEGRELRILVARDGDQLVGIAPLLRRRVRERSIPIRRIELLASGEDEADEIHSEYLDFLIERGREEAVTDAFWQTLRSLGDWDEIQLRSIVASSPLVPALRSALRDEVRVDLEETARVPAVIVPLPGDLETFLAAQGKKMREDLRRHRRMLEKSGKVRLRRAASVDELREMFTTFTDLHQRLWRSRGKPGCFASPRFTRFHERVSERLFARGQVDMWLLEVDDRAVAARYSFHMGQRMFEYQSGLDPEFEPKISTGVQAAYYCIEDAIARGFREYDLGEGQQAYKLRWAHQIRPTLNVSVRRFTPAAQARAAIDVAETQLRMVKRMIEAQKGRG